MKLTMLGTGHAMVRECYNTCFALEENGTFFLTDAGGGREIIFRLRDAGISPEKVHDIFVTHRHLDHITGVLWLMRMYSGLYGKMNFQEEVRIYGHEGVCEILREMRRMIFPSFDSPLFRIIPVRDGETVSILNHDVTFFDLHSRKAEQYGYTMSFDGKKLTCLGDEGFHEETRPYAEKSTWLMHEAFCQESEEEKYHPHLIAHSTVKDACLHAEDLQAENVILYHTEDSCLPKRKHMYTEEGRKYFRGGIFVPDDLESMIL